MLKIFFKFISWRLIFIFCVLLLHFTLIAQWGPYVTSKRKVKSIEYYIPTENIVIKKGVKLKSQTKVKTYRTIYLKDPVGKLYGNACALEVTRKFGFEYAIEPNKMWGSVPKAQKFFNNLLVKSGLVFRRSPFWKVLLLKRLNQCKQLSGDFVG